MSDATSVEIFWPSAMPPDPALDAQAELEAVGVDVSCRLQPTRRGLETVALVVLTSPPMVAFLNQVFDKFAEDAHLALQRFVQRLLGRKNDAPSLHSVIFESGNGARVVFTPGLPLEAFQQALTIVPQNPGSLWTWDPTNARWLRPDDGRSAERRSEGDDGTS